MVGKHPHPRRVLKADSVPNMVLSVMVDDMVSERGFSRNRARWAGKHPVANEKQWQGKLYILGNHSAQNGLEEGREENLKAPLML